MAQVLSSEPKEHKSLCPDTGLGRPDDRTEFYVKIFYVPFLLSSLQ